MPRLTVHLNGKQVTADYRTIGAGTTMVSEDLLYWLRERFGQHGPRFGCGVAQCGACTVLLDGVPTRSCVRQVHTVSALADIRTLDGLAADEPHPLQQAFVREQAGQCAFCVNGMVMGSLGWLESRIAAGNRAVPSTDEIKDFLSGASTVSTQNYLCRCGAHARIVAAIQQAAEVMVR